MSKTAAALTRKAAALAAAVVLIDGDGITSDEPVKSKNELMSGTARWTSMILGILRVF